MDWRQIGDFMFYLCTAVTVLFAVLYLFLAPWWRTVTGRNIMSVMGAMALAFSYFSWAIHVGGVPQGFDAMRAVLFAGLTLSVGWRTVIFIRHHVLRSLRGTGNEEDTNELENAR